VQEGGTTRVDLVVSDFNIADDIARIVWLQIDGRHTFRAATSGIFKGVGVDDYVAAVNNGSGLAGNASELVLTNLHIISVVSC
jgi:hypothetical protein